MDNPAKAILGTGWTFPPTFSRVTASVDMASDDQDIRESLRVLFTTALGERTLLPEYGSQLGQMVFRSIDTTLKTQLAGAIRTAVLYWEPRIDVDAIDIQPEATLDGLVVLTIYYTIRLTNSRSNLVFPFYLQEGTLVPRS